MELFKILPKMLDPMMGKTVIRFTSHGCMGQIIEFNYIGIIVDSEIHNKYKYYKVKVLKDLYGEAIYNNIKQEYVTVPSWYLTHLGHGIYRAYD